MRANYLASPPLVVAYALAGTMDIDLQNEPLGTDRQGQPVFLKDIWPSQREIADTILKSVRSEMFQTKYAEVFQGDETWSTLPVPSGRPLRVGREVDVRQEPAVLPRHDGRARLRSRRSSKARVLAVLGDSITTDHISPAGSIKADSPAGRYLIERGVSVADFNSYGARRGNDEVMVRGTFANIRLRNRLAPGTEGGWTRHLPDGEQMTIFDASRRYIADGVPLDRDRRQGIWLGLVARLGGQGAAASGHPGRDRRKLRAHPPVEPGRHGDLAAPVQARRRRAESLGLTGEEVYSIEGLPAAIAGRFTRRPRAQCVGRTHRRAARSVSRWPSGSTLPRRSGTMRHGGILPYVLRQLLHAGA